MNIHLVFIVIAFFSYLLMGIHSLLFNSKSQTNRTFFLICGCLAFWAFAAIMVLIPVGREQARFWLAASFFGVITFYCAVLHFSLSLSGKTALHPAVIVLIYFPSLFFNFYNIFVSPILFKDVIYENGSFTLIQTTRNLIFYLYTSCAYLSSVISFIIILTWGLKTRLKRQKFQALIIGIIMFISISAGVADEVYLPLIFKGYQTRGLSVMTLILWMAGIWYAMIRFRFLAIIPAAVSNDILLNIDEYIALIDSEKRIVKSNKCLAEAMQSGNPAGRPIIDLVPGQTRLILEIDKI